jgi:hypothetical protein
VGSFFVQTRQLDLPPGFRTTWKTLGAMYFSYRLSIPPVLVLLLWWLTAWRFAW